VKVIGDVCLGSDPVRSMGNIDNFNESKGMLHGPQCCVRGECLPRQSCRSRFFNDLQTRGERLRPSTSCKTTLFVDRIVDRKIQILTFSKTATDKLGVGVLSPTASGNLVVDRTDSLLVMPPS
jgi:hypothetical protein